MSEIDINDMNDLVQWELNSHEKAGCGFQSGSGVMGKIRGHQRPLGERLELPLIRQPCAALLSVSGSQGTIEPRSEYPSTGGLPRRTPRSSTHPSQKSLNFRLRISLFNLPYAQVRMVEAGQNKIRFRWTPGSDWAVLHLSDAEIIREVYYVPVRRSGSIALHVNSASQTPTF
jgi:hypothetical protein